MKIKCFVIMYCLLTAHFCIDARTNDLYNTTYIACQSVKHNFWTYLIFINNYVILTMSLFLFLFIRYGLYLEKVEDPNRSKPEDRQYNSQTANNDLQNTTQKTKDWPTRIPLKTGCELSCSGRVSSSCSTLNFYF
jgi:hypothetical protein